VLTGGAPLLRQRETFTRPKIAASASPAAGRVLLAHI
jgi:hypothetical protein